MPRQKLSSRTDQVVEILRRGMAEGRWKEVLPGRRRLAEELGCSHWTIDEAVNQLSKQGLLVSQGTGRQRRINLSESAVRAAALRVKILLYEKVDRKNYYLVEIFHLLEEAGHEVSFAQKSLRDLGMDTGRVVRYVESIEADAWLVLGGSGELLDWFSRQDTPAFALFGRLTNVSMASVYPSKADAYSEAVARLAALGHKRIVYLVREERRKPTPGFHEKIFIEQLGKNGIEAGAFNLPDWEETPEGLHAMLNSLFQHTPPTAMLINGPVLFHAVRSYLGNCGFLVPMNVSLVCTDPDLSFQWCTPAVTHISWDSRPLVQRVVKWAENVSRGRDDRRKSSCKARLVLGGTMGPARPVERTRPRSKGI